ncbi:MAG: hypothetical protein JOZ72_11150 [Alphaproteobacteria bacterium]|nr:hypothetical protein [Alphaproteobacteria bacterium]
MKHALTVAAAGALSLVLTVASPALADPPAWLMSVADQDLSSVDGSTLSLSPTEGHLLLSFVSHNGETQKTTFTYLSDSLGTVLDEGDNAKVSGFFRQTDTGLEIQYGDGRTASLYANSEDGVTVMRKYTSGATACVSWYPSGHHFSEEERRAAVAAYAQSLGINQTPAAAPPPPSSSKKKQHVLAQHIAAQPQIRCPGPMRPPAPAMNVASASVHAIDAAPGAPPPPAAMSVSAPASVPPPPPKGPDVVPPGKGASDCLSVEAQGTFVGFHNRCGNDVQTTYCVQSAVDPSVACGTGTKAASILAGGFTGIAPGSAAMEHDIRWVGCSGGPSDVAAQLDRADPPAGRCVKKTP